MTCVAANLKHTLEIDSSNNVWRINMHFSPFNCWPHTHTNTHKHKLMLSRDLLLISEWASSVLAALSYHLFSSLWPFSCINFLFVIVAWVCSLRFYRQNRQNLNFTHIFAKYFYLDYDTGVCGLFSLSISISHFLFFALNLLTMVPLNFFFLRCCIFGFTLSPAFFNAVFCSHTIWMISSWFNCTLLLLLVIFFHLPHRHFLASDLCHSNINSFLFFAPILCAPRCAQSFETHHNDWMCTLHAVKNGDLKLLATVM